MARPWKLDDLNFLNLLSCLSPLSLFRDVSIINPQSIAGYIFLHIGSALATIKRATVCYSYNQYILCYNWFRVSFENVVMFSFWARVWLRNHFVMREIQNSVLPKGLFINAKLLRQGLKNCWFSLFEVKLPAVDALPIPNERALLFGSTWVDVIRKGYSNIAPLARFAFFRILNSHRLLHETNQKPQQLCIEIFSAAWIEKLH